MCYKGVIRIIARVNRRTNADIYYENFQTLNVKQINMYVICLFMYCFHHNLPLEVFDHYFTLNRNVHTTHGSVSYYMYPPVPLTWQRGAKHRGVKIWNQFLGQEINIDASQPVFKHKCKRIISAGHLDYIWANLKCCYSTKSVCNVL